MGQLRCGLWAGDVFVNGLFSNSAVVFGGTANASEQLMVSCTINCGVKYRGNQRMRYSFR